MLVEGLFVYFAPGGGGAPLGGAPGGAPPDRLSEPPPVIGTLLVSTRSAGAPPLYDGFPPMLPRFVVVDTVLCIIIPNGVAVLPGELPGAMLLKPGAAAPPAVEAAPPVSFCPG